jgi:hypothetical protein
MAYTCNSDRYKEETKVQFCFHDVVEEGDFEYRKCDVRIILK